MASGLGNLRSILLSYRDRSAALYHRRAGWRKARAAGLPVLLALFASSGVAAERPPACAPEGGEAVRVAGVETDWSLRLDDGRSLRLAGIDPVAATPQHPDFADAARGRLAGWLTGRTATLVPLGEAPDRWGRTAGLIFATTGAGTEPDAAPLSVALALVDAGLARGRPEPGFAACWPAVLGAERAARQSGLGLWSDPYYAVRESGSTDAALDLAGTMALVEGRVTRVGQGRTRLFVGLGRGDGEVTLSIARRDLFILGQLGLDDTRLIGLDLRARGEIEDRSGASIDVSDPAQIEVLAGREVLGGR